MLKRIDLFMPPLSQYGVLHHFTKRFYEALTRYGISCRILEAEKYNPKPFLTEIFSDPPDCTLSFNGLLPDNEGHFFCEMINIPHIAVLVDSPNHFSEMIKSPLNIVTCPDKFAVDFFKGLSFKNVFFLPHAVEKTLYEEPSSIRPIDVLMPASCIDYESNREGWKGRFSADLCHVLDEAAEQTMAEQDTPYVQAFAESISRHMIKPGNTLTPSTIPLMDALDELENYVRGKDRVDLVKSIKSSKVEIYGSAIGARNWKKYLGDKYPNVTIHDPVSFDRVLELMKRSKVVLNSCPWIKNGTHERILSAMASGAAVLTADNAYMREQFKENESVLFYRYADMNSVDKKISDLLKDDAKRVALAKAGQKIAHKNHTWDQRAETLVKEVNAILPTLPSRGLVK